MTPELETLDQLDGSPMPLLLIQRAVYPSVTACAKGVRGLLSAGDVRLTDGDGTEVPQWRWRELFAPGVDAAIQWTGLTLSLTEQGARKIG